MIALDIAMSITKLLIILNRKLLSWNVGSYYVRRRPGMMKRNASSIRGPYYNKGPFSIFEYYLHQHCFL
jgi:hypothetical protein